MNNTSARQNPDGSHKAAIIIILALIVFAAFNVLSSMPLPTSGGLLYLKSGKILVDNAHAEIKHREEAEQALNCIAHHAPFMAFRQTVKGSKDTWHILCQYPYVEPGSKVFDVIVEEIEEGVYRLKTAFQPKGGALPAIERWLLSQNVQKVTPPVLPFLIQILP